MPAKPPLKTNCAFDVNAHEYHLKQELTSGSNRACAHDPHRLPRQNRASYIARLRETLWQLLLHSHTEGGCLHLSFPELLACPLFSRAAEVAERTLHAVAATCSLPSKGTRLAIAGLVCPRAKRGGHLRRARSRRRGTERGGPLGRARWRCAAQCVLQAQDWKTGAPGSLRRLTWCIDTCGTKSGRRFRANVLLPNRALRAWQKCWSHKDICHLPDRNISDAVTASCWRRPCPSWHLRHLMRPRGRRHFVGLACSKTVIQERGRRIGRRRWRSPWGKCRRFGEQPMQDVHAGFFQSARVYGWWPR
mmetsp:Transcript_87478/g.230473  ORF Transcript_87478/g.230473 Transcript_87478/m.230473 type:complete len:305 (+) Transcript_87478:67-981(+)